MKLNVIIFGVTGMVGEGVLLTTLACDNIESVLVVSRRPCNVKHNKLKELIHNDFFDYSAIETQLTGYDACFFCLGVSSVGMKEAEYTKFTYDLTMQAARTLAKVSPGMTFCYVSGKGTDSSEKGRLMWARVKGRTENDLAKLPFKAVFSFRPGLMKPVAGQRNVMLMLRALAWPFPVWKVLFPNTVCTLEDLGLAMIQVSNAGYSNKILENVDIARCARIARSR